MLIYEAKKTAKYKIPNEMNTAENLIQHLPFGDIDSCFFLKLVTKKPGFH